MYVPISGLINYYILITVYRVKCPDMTMGDTLIYYMMLDDLVKFLTVAHFF